MRDWEKGSRNLARVCCVARAPNHVKSDYALIRVLLRAAQVRTLNDIVISYNAVFEDEILQESTVNDNN